MTRPISSRMHGMLDYPVGIALIAAPWLFGFSDVGGAAVVLPVALGVMVLGQSVVTDYELSLADILPLPAHLGVDVIGGIVLVASPFILGFVDESANAWLPHVIVGLGLIMSGLLTQPYRSDTAAPADSTRQVQPEPKTGPWPEER